jgi:hypothetical protein
MRVAAAGVVILLALPLQAAQATVEAPPDLLVLLTDTGEEREGLPVLQPLAEAEDVKRALERGLSGTLLRVYRWTQAYLQRAEGIAPEPAYVLLSDRQGGFAREGFFLGDVDKGHVGYVDVHREWAVTGRFGAMDQIVPHELAHVIRRQLAGPLAEGGTNQVHALGVRTDRVVAFNEGFAEHFQVMAVDDPDADPATRSLADDGAPPRRVERHLEAYRRELTARVALATRMRMGFVLWFSNGEDILRYHAVKANAFAREPGLPDRLLRDDDPYAAYLLESVLPGDPDGPVKSLSRMIASEAVVSALFHRWATDDGLRRSYRDDAFYELFGARAAGVTPLQNLYLKLFHVFYIEKPQDALDVIEGYRASFPDEAARVDAIATEVFHGQRAEAPPEIWLANPGFRTGTTLFDQLRGLPRVHTFDLNAASPVDLAGIPGVDPALARAIIDAAPYASVGDLGRVAGVTDAVLENVREMVAEMQALRAEVDEEEVTLSLATILMPYVWRALGVVLLAATTGALLYRAVRSDGAAHEGKRRRPSLLRSAVNGLGAALVGLLSGWAVATAGGLVAPVVVAVLFGVPAGLICLWKTRRPARAARATMAWVAAALPAAALITPWF